MLKKILRTIITLLGLALGLALCAYLGDVAQRHDFFGLAFVGEVWFEYAFSAGVVLLCGIVAFLVSKKIVDAFLKFIANIDSWQSKMTLADLFCVFTGLALGLVLAYLCGSLTRSIPIGIVSLIVSVITYIIFPYVCIWIMWKRRNDITLPSFLRKKKSDKEQTTVVRILDTSAIIDGRILDVLKTDFISGKILIPVFVVNELSRIADNADSLKRAKGRRGLDIVQELQSLENIKCELSKTDYADIDDTDTKLIRMALDENAQIITTDYNFCKAAIVHKVKTLNINELTNAVKTTVVPGEKIDVIIAKEGKERQQGLAYLPDGTMIVVEDARHLTGTKQTVEVVNVLQTSAGRMVFAEIAEKAGN